MFFFFGKLKALRSDPVTLVTFIDALNAMYVQFNDYIPTGICVRVFPNFIKHNFKFHIDVRA